MKLRGTQDFFSVKERLFSELERVVISVMNKYRYERIRFPLIERAELFKRNLESSDIVNKELYEFKDRGGRDIALVPEGTAPTARAVVENSLYYSKLFYISPFFRYDRPQNGRYRQLHQFGVEIVGYPNEHSDAEAVILLNEIAKHLGIGLTFKVNFLGSTDTRERYKTHLRDSIDRESLCKDCSNRYEKNILRVLDCKSCKIDSKDIEAFLDSSELESYKKILSLLDRAGINYEKTNLVRGLDYYTGFVFEAFAGSNLAIGGGGRYDSLYGEIGKKDMPSVGFGAGIDRLINIMKERSREKADLTLAYSTPNEKDEAFSLANKLRDSISVEFPFKDMKLYKQLSKAETRFVAIVGEDELSNGEVLLRDMENSTQERIKIEDIVKVIKERRCTEQA